MPQVRFGEDFEYRDVQMADLLVNRHILLSSGSRDVPDPKDNVRLFERRLGFLAEALSHGVIVELETGGVDKEDLAIRIGIYPQERMPGGIRNLAYRRQGFSDASVQDRRFSDVRPTDDSHVTYFHFLEFTEWRIALILFASAWLATEGFIFSKNTSSNTIFGPFLQFH